jgi:hypothetical protein
MQYKKKLLTDNHYQSLLIGLQYARNRIIFFTLFCVYALLSVLATTDKDIYMLNPIKMPLLNMELPLVSFYIAIPLFLVVLQFNLLYHLKTYKESLYKAYLQNAKDVHSLPKGLFEGALLYSSNGFFYKAIKFAIFAIVYIFPIITLSAFYIRFSDYQSFGISSWHLLLIVGSIAFLFVFKNLLHFKSNKISSATLKKYIRKNFKNAFFSYSAKAITNSFYCNYWKV